VRWLRDKDQVVSFEAARALATLGDIGGHVLMLALEEPDSGMRVYAARALGQLGSLNAVVALMNALGDESADVRAVAVEALGDIGGMDALKGTLAALDDAHGMVRRTSIETLARFGDNPTVVATLIRMLGDESDYLCEAAAKSLGQIGLPSVAALLNVVNTGERTARWWAITALGYSRDAHAIAPLVEALNDTDPELRARAAQALGRIGDTGAFEPVLSVLEDPDFGVLFSAVRALGELGDPRAFDVLITYLGGDDELASQAAVGLGKLGDARAVGPLLDAIRHSRFIRAEWALALLAHNCPAATPQLLAALRDEDARVRCCAADAVSGPGNLAAFEPVARLLGDADVEVRWQVVSALYRIDSERAVPYAISALADQATIVRLVAAQVLAWRGEQGDERTIMPLIRALEDPDDNVRYFAADGLGHIGDPQALPALTQMQRSDAGGIQGDDGDDANRDVAARAIKLILLQALMRGQTILTDETNERADRG